MGTADGHAALRRLQGQLQQLYRLELAHDVGDFVTSDPQLLRQLGCQSDPAPQEMVFVRVEEDGIDVSLYFDAGALQRLRANHTGDLNVGLHDYCLAIEGVSHFILLLARAQQARQTTAFEMELQAEIDKYVLLCRQTADDAEIDTTDIHVRLFDAAVLREGLDPAAAQRYRDANRYAARYCLHLRTAHCRHGPLPAIVEDELQRFYWLPLPEKIQHIEASPAY